MTSFGLHKAGHLQVGLRNFPFLPTTICLNNLHLSCYVVVIPQPRSSQLKIHLTLDSIISQKNIVVAYLCMFSSASEHSGFTLHLSKAKSYFPTKRKESSASSQDMPSIPKNLSQSRLHFLLPLTATAAPSAALSVASHVLPAPALPPASSCQRD